MDLITNWGGNQTLTANWGQNELNSNNKYQLCYPCNKNLSFIKVFFLSNLKKTTGEFNYATHSGKRHKVIEFPL